MSDATQIIVDFNLNSELSNWKIVDDVVMAVNSYIRTLVRQEKILGGKSWADAEENPASEVTQGKLQINFDFTAVYPAQHITIKSKLVNDYIEEIFN